MMKVQDIILILLVILSIAVALWYIIGNSPTFEQTILIFILTGLFAITTKLTSANSKLSHLEKGFSCLARDFKAHIQHI